MRRNHTVIYPLIIVFVTLFGGTLMAGYLDGSGPSIVPGAGGSSSVAEGFAESIAYKSGTVALENGICSGNFDFPMYFAGSKEGSIFIFEPSFFYSGNYKVSYDSFSWIFLSRYRVSVSVPYILRSLEYEGNTYKAKGIGDPKAAISYFASPGGVPGVTTLNVTLPAGDESADDKEASASPWAAALPR